MQDLVIIMNTERKHTSSSMTHYSISVCFLPISYLFLFLGVNSRES